jgi:hypothetical protein
MLWVALAPHDLNTAFYYKKKKKEKKKMENKVNHSISDG